MAAKTFNSWLKKLDHTTRRNLKAEDVWEAAAKAAEEKLTTTNRPITPCLTCRYFIPMAGCTISKGCMSHEPRTSHVARDVVRNVAREIRIIGQP